MTEKELQKETLKEPTIKKIYNEIKMRRISLVFFSLIISIIITYLATTITFYVPPWIRSTSYDKVRGVPFELERKLSTNATNLKSVQISYPLNPYFLTFLFWFSGSLTFLLLLQHPKWKMLLIFIGITALLLMGIDINSSPSCLRGYPIHLSSICTDVPEPPINQIWVFAMLNFSFWAVIALVGTSVFFYAYKSPYLMVRLFVPPLILTLYSLAYQASCRASILFSCPSGRGLPLIFTGEGSLVFFVIDYVFWWIAYSFVIFIKLQIEHNRASQISPQITSIAPQKDNLEEKS